MQEYLKKMKEGLTKIQDTSIITDNDLLKIHNDALEGYTDGDIRDLLTKKPKFQSVHDKFVSDKLEAQKAELTKAHADLLNERDAELSKLKASIPRPNSPEDIKKRLDVETDPIEKRLLKAEYDSAILAEKYSTLESEANQSKKIAKDAELFKQLNQHIKDKGYVINDPSLFLQFGDNAISEIDKFGNSLTELINGRVSEIATKKYGSNPSEQGGSQKKENFMTIEEIESQYSGVENREMRIKLYEENGH